MKLESVADVMAVRTYRLFDDSNRIESSRGVVLRLGKPQRSPESTEFEEYYCPFQLIGVGDERVRYAAGVDAFQAIELALGLIGGLMGRMGEEHKGRLRWDYDDQGGFGFPQS